jgi:hypothetical protein
LSLLLALALAAVQQPEPGEAEQVDMFHFSYFWPEAAERDPALLAWLRSRRQRAHAQALVDERASERAARANGHELRPYYFTQSWRLAGDGGGLLSLAVVVETFANGGPPEGRVETLLWDSAEHRPVPAVEVIGAMLPGLERRYCASLNEERADIRGDAIRPDPCPRLAEQVLTLEDIDGDGRFDRLLISIEPNVVAPDDDDPYTPEVDLEAADLAQVPERWRGAFQPVDDD